MEELTAVVAFISARILELRVVVLFFLPRYFDLFEALHIQIWCILYQLLLEVVIPV